MLLLAYPAFLATFFLTVFVAGLAGRQEVVLPPGLRTVLRYATAPLYGFRPVDATTVGYCTVFYAGWQEADENRLRIHERYHRFQSLQHCPGNHLIDWSDGHIGYATFPSTLELILGAVVYGALYVREYLRHGYHANAYEVAARIAAGQE